MSKRMNPASPEQGWGSYNILYVINTYKYCGWDTATVTSVTVELR